MTGELKKRDYKNFGQVAKVRFRPMCKALGFEQTKPTTYYRRREDWYDYIALGTSQWGGNGFDIYYGIRREKTDEEIRGVLGRQLERAEGKPSKFNRFTKADIERNATEAHEMFNLQAEPFLNTFKHKKDLGNAYLSENSMMIYEQLNGLSHRNELYIEGFCEFMIWAGLDEVVDTVRDGSFTQFRKKSFLKTWLKKL